MVSKALRPDRLTSGDRQRRKQGRPQEAER
jgi:hypothetical protein